MADLTTKYMGIDLKNPLVASAGPLWKEVDNVRRVEDAGAAAVVLHSLFEEQINQEAEILDERLSSGTDAFAEALSYFPELDDYKLAPDAYVEHVAKVKAAVDIPVIGSLNGISKGGWLEYGKKIAEAGANALELNIYFTPTDLSMSAADVEAGHVELVKALRETIEIPIAVKIGSQFSAVANFGRALKGAGADALVLFNRFYQPDLDLKELDVVSQLTLSSSDELLLRLRWAALLHGRLDLDLGLSGGVHTVEDVVKAIAAGGTVAMTTSALLEKGIEHMATLKKGFERWLEGREYSSVSELRGSMSAKNMSDPAAFERGTYIKVLNAF